jgi:hypothetical protein
MDLDNLPAPLSSVVVKPHLAAGVPYENALREAGHVTLPLGQRADVYLTDLDIPGPAFRPVIDKYVEAGAVALTYPHGIGPIHYYDGIWPAYERISGMFVVSEGDAEVYRRMRYPHPMYVIGWAYGELLPFRGTDTPRRVLFAPIHPLENGFLSDWQQDLNREAFAALLEAQDIELTVRYLYELEANGLTRVPGVEYVQGLPDNTFDDIDRADVVVAQGTYAYLAAARGAPVVMFGQHIHPSNAEHLAEPTYAVRWHEWRDYLRYPLDLRDGPAAELIAAAARGGEPVREWKARFIGEELDARHFSDQLELARATARLPELRRFVAVADAAEAAATPELIAAYAQVLGPADDASLLLLGPGADPEALVDELQRSFDAAGLGEPDLPDLVLRTDPVTLWDVRAIAARAVAFVSAHAAPEPFAALARHDVGNAGGLRSAAEETWQQEAASSA